MGNGLGKQGDWCDGQRHAFTLYRAGPGKCRRGAGPPSGRVSLARYMPRSMVEARLRKRLTPGTVIKISARMGDGEVHDKYFVVVHVTDDGRICAACVVNSSP